MVKIYIAPMAGVTDYTFRRIISEFDPDLMYSEMVSVNAVKMKNRKTLTKILKLLPNDGVQIFGRNISDIVECGKYLEKQGVTNIDINMGCPMPKIIKNGYGAALLDDVSHIKLLMSTLKNELSSKVKLSMKIRIGYNGKNSSMPIAKIADDLKLHHITIHGRTREQMYSGTANWDEIKNIKDKVSILVIGNGDIFTANNAYERVQKSGVDGVMLARGICGNPWLIKQIKEIFQHGKVLTKVSYNDKINMALKHIEYVKEDNPSEKFDFSIKKHLCWYLKGIPKSNDAKNRLNKMDNYDEIIELLQNLKRINKVN